MPDATAHRDPVHEGDGRLAISEQQVVEPIFGMEEGTRRNCRRWPRCRRSGGYRRPRRNRAPRHDRSSPPATASSSQPFDRAHRSSRRTSSRQRVDRLRPVEPDAADGPPSIKDQDIITHERSISRPTIIRMISLVPSRMRMDPQIAPEALDRIILQIAIAAMELQRTIDHRRSGIGRQTLGHRGELGFVGRSRGDLGGGDIEQHRGLPEARSPYRPG
jgi:hypothetical protein